MEYFKSNYMPILALADCHRPGCAEFAAFPEHCLDKSPESEMVDELKDTGGYFLMKKNSTNGFHEREFIKGLTINPQISHFIVTGDCTDICVLQLALSIKTWFTAQNRISDIIVPVDCVETYDLPGHASDFMNIAAYKIMATCGIRFVSSVETE
jgi:nicotinamidase-related amidase